MRAILILAALAVTSASAQTTTFDLIATGGVAVEGPSDVLITGVAPALGIAGAVAPPVLGQRLRFQLAASLVPEGSGGLPDRTAAVGLSVEAPLSGGRNGVYFSLGGAYVDYDGPDRSISCEPNCPTHSFGPSRYRGLAWSGGIGARVPITGRTFVSGEASAFIIDEGRSALPRLHLGLGYRLR